MCRNIKRLVVLASLALLWSITAVSACAQHVLPASSQVEARARQILAQMTQDEKLEYIGGVRDFFVRGIPRLGVPELKMSDGPLGTRNDGAATAYPCLLYTSRCV